MPPASAFVVVAVGAVLGAWLRWLLVAKLNTALPTLPLGTLIANVSGGFMVGFAVAWLWYGALPYSLPRTVPPRKQSVPLLPTKA